MKHRFTSLFDCDHAKVRGRSFCTGVLTVALSAGLTATQSQAADLHRPGNPASADLNWELPLLSSRAYAIQVSGKVTDTKGEPLPGVSVVLKGTTAGATTGVDGSYSLNVPDGQENGTLVFSYIGFLKQEVPIGNKSVVDVQLQADTKALEEVVVIGYGTQRRSDVTGAVASVKEAELRERPTPSLNQALAGKMPGVQVNTNSGRPGGRTNLRIRGFSSINSSNNPLYVIDGVMMPQSNLAQSSSPIDYINPNDIASIEIL